MRFDYHSELVLGNCFRSVLPVTLPLLLMGCAVYAPPDAAPRAYLERLQTQTTGDLTVSAVVLSDAEADAAFAAPLTRDGIQLIWLEIDNASDRAMALNFLSIDEDYFSPAEAAQMSRRFLERRSDDKAGYFYAQHAPLVIDPGSQASGFVFTNHDPGGKAFDVELFGDGASHRFEFAMVVPGFDADFMLTRPGAVYADDELEDIDLEGLREYIQALPCCVFGGDGETPGDPLNIVFVADGEELLHALMRRGWDLTETLRLGTSWRTVVSSVFKSRYRTSPVSPLFLFDRPQDAAFQKARRTVDERNHMRLWRAPVNVDGAPVWVGQISRDIGVKLTRRGFVTHRIDAVVDEARSYLVLDVIEADRLEMFGYAAGVGRSAPEAPRFNYTLDPYYTDGLRAVMVLGNEVSGFDGLVDLGWERQPRDSILERAPQLP